uniref:Uncharacterized protein n=1 Tax=Globodera rostochiensis TaxID=31243 RepID=A0A914HJY6_GLORO
MEEALPQQEKTPAVQQILWPEDQTTVAQAVSFPRRKYSRAQNPSPDRNQRKPYRKIKIDELHLRINIDDTIVQVIQKINIDIHHLITIKNRHHFPKISLIEICCRLHNHNTNNKVALGNFMNRKRKVRHHYVLMHRHRHKNLTKICLIKQNWQH